MSDNTLDVNAEYLRQQANFKHENELDGIEREQEMRDADVEMTPVREMWDSNRTAYQDKLNESIRNEKAAKAKTFSDVLNIARENPTVLEGINSITKTKKGGKSRVFRKKSNKTKTKKVSRRNRRSRNIRRSRNSRAHKRK